MESVGFKEWAVVCEALGSGRQSIILRKGGIAEGRDGFSFKHRQFFLFPTWFHEQSQKVRIEQGGLFSPSNAERSTPNMQRQTQTRISMPESDDVIEIRYAAHLELSRTITSWKIAAALESLHILQPDVVRERFDYDEAPGLHVGLVRVFRIEPVWSFPNEPKYGGCRSWVKLSDPPSDLRLKPVLNDAEFDNYRKSFFAIAGDSVAAVP